MLPEIGKEGSQPGAAGEQTTEQVIALHEENTCLVQSLMGQREHSRIRGAGN
jgi:hypothetical protein